VRTRELREAHARLKILDQAKSEFLNLISHELRTPLNGLLGIGEFVFEELYSNSENKELRDLFELSRLRILSILDDALLLTQIEVEGDKFRPAPIPACVALTRAVAGAAEFAKSRQVSLGSPPTTPGFILGQVDLVVRALTALLETAVKFSKTGETVELGCDASPDSIRVMITSRGEMIPVDVLAKFFDLFSISEASTPGGNLGLGPAVAARILSLFGGSVAVENCNPSGVRLTICFKSAQPPTEPVRVSANDQKRAIRVYLGREWFTRETPVRGGFNRLQNAPRMAQ
jgi:signal transduction histidine kinase